MSANISGNSVAIYDRPEVFRYGFPQRRCGYMLDARYRELFLNKFEITRGYILATAKKD